MDRTPTLAVAKIKARRLAGPVGADQGVDASAADPQIDVANGEEAREFLGQSVGFKNELIGQAFIRLAKTINDVKKHDRLAWSMSTLVD